MIVFVVETLGGWQLLLIRMMLIILKRIMLIILSVLITWFTHSLRIEAAPLSHSLSYLFEVNTYHHPHYIVIIMITILIINVMMMTRYATRTASAASGT